MSGTIDEAKLLAYAGGQLSAEDISEVEAFLTGNPERAAEVAAWRRQDAAIAALYAPALAEPVPSRLSPRLIAGAQRRDSRQWIMRAAAAVVLVGLGAGGGWFGRDALGESPIDRLMASATAAHALYVREQRHAVEVGADDRAHLLSWLSNRIEQPINAPDLSAQGFNLVGGRLLPPEEGTLTGPAAQLMYENATAERLTVYVTAALPDRADVYRHSAVGPLDAMYWANYAITCTVVGQLPEDQMRAVARQVYSQLTWRPDPAGTS